MSTEQDITIVVEYSPLLDVTHRYRAILHIPASRHKMILFSVTMLVRERPTHAVLVDETKLY